MGEDNSETVRTIPGVRVDPMAGGGRLFLVTPLGDLQILLAHGAAAAALFAAPFLLGPVALMHIVAGAFAFLGDGGGIIAIAGIIGAVAALRVYLQQIDWKAALGALRPTRFEIWPEAIARDGTVYDIADLGDVRTGRSGGRLGVAVARGGGYILLAAGLTEGQASPLAEEIRSAFRDNSHRRQTGGSQTGDGRVAGKEQTRPTSGSRPEVAA